MKIGWNFSKQVLTLGSNRLLVYSGVGIVKFISVIIYRLLNSSFLLLSMQHPRRINSSFKPRGPNNDLYAADRIG